MGLKNRMLSTTVMPLAVVVGVAGAVSIGSAGLSPARANPCGAKRACNPCTGRRGSNPRAAKKGCNPCAVKHPCNPCAAKGGCSPCGASGGQSTSRCVIPRLQKAALGNPCAAKNPRAAKKGCNPCGAANPCNPCAAAPEIELTAAESRKAYDCILSDMRKAYPKSGLWVAKAYPKWERFSKVAYQSSTHGGRFVQNYANSNSYGRYEKAGRMKAGTYLAKDSFTVTREGKIGVGPLFVMRKMEAGWNPASGDWKYAMVMPNGAFFGETKGKNAANMTFCIECHIGMKDEQDSMFFLPEEYRR